MYVTFDDEAELVADDWLDEVIEETSVDSGVGVSGTRDRQTAALQAYTHTQIPVITKLL